LVELFAALWVGVADHADVATAQITVGQAVGDARQGLAVVVL
jgi:hypothetical protein